MSLGTTAALLGGLTAIAAPSSARRVTTEPTTEAVTTLAIGGRPTAAAVSLDGATAFISNTTTGTIDVIDLNSREFTGSIAVGGPTTAPVVTSTRVFTTSVTDGQVVAIDPASRSVVARIKVGSRPSPAVLSKDATRLFVANTGSDSVSIVSIDDERVTATIPVGDRPLAPVQGTGSQSEPWSQRLFVTNADARSLTTIDLNKGRAIEQRPVGNDPVRPAVSAPMGVINDLVAVANSGDNTVTVLRQGDGETVQTVRVGRDPGAVVSSIDGTSFFVANAGSASVSVIDVDASPARVTATIPVGDTPGTPVLSPNGRVLFVPSSRDARVSIIDTNTRMIRGSYVVGRGPSGLALSPDATTLVVPNSEDGTVSLIDLAQPVLPLAPSSVTVDAAATRVKVRWPLSNQAGVTGYVATAIPGGRTCTSARATCTITGLTRGKRYRVMVQALNAYGAGAATMSAPLRLR